MKTTFDASPAYARLRLGLLGCSRMANRIIDAAPSSKKIAISAIASRSLAKATDVLLHLPGAIAIDNYEDLIASKEVDAIYISVPNSMHFEWALKAIHRGKHVLVEKPAVMQLAELEELAFEAKKAGVIVMEAMWYRYHAQTKFLREQRLSGALGKLKAPPVAVAVVDRECGAHIPERDVGDLPLAIPQHQWPTLVGRQPVQSDLRRSGDAPIHGTETLRHGGHAVDGRFEGTGQFSRDHLRVVAVASEKGIGRGFAHDMD